MGWWNPSLTKNIKNKIERDDRSSTKNGTEQNRNETKLIEKGTIVKKRRRKERFSWRPWFYRTEQNDLKKLEWPIPRWGAILEDGLGNYFKFIVHSNPFLADDRSREPVLLCMVQNLSGFCFLFFYFSCFWRERGKEMDKIPKLCNVFPVFHSRV